MGRFIFKDTGVITYLMPGGAVLQMSVPEGYVHTAFFFFTWIGCRFCAESVSKAICISPPMVIPHVSIDDAEFSNADL